MQTDTSALITETDIVVKSVKYFIGLFQVYLTLCHEAWGIIVKIKKTSSIIFLILIGAAQAH